ncbi:TRIB2 [Branchiostoma lanceolatum]|uniref:TRIB2 protein n=1 Tax=Branchiostoma lanceolatum TaxID=7740 RepID=A0A8K0EEN7_BRALA|nr:TRIB2 [Branchiostoma lanceolatum]
MNIYRSNPIPIHDENYKTVPFDPPPDLSCSPSSPVLSPSSPPCFPQEQEENVSVIGQYLLTKQLDGGLFEAIHTLTEEEYVCKVLDISRYREAMAANFNVLPHENVNQIIEVILGDKNAYVFFERSHGDMHSYVRNKRRLKEDEAMWLFFQIVSAVAHCHDNGVVLRDLKLRKFVFQDPEKTQLKLESLEDTYLLQEPGDDRLSDKHGCPAYVSPEILSTQGSYSGKAADVWSLGVMLYTMLVGRYPFHDTEPQALFTKIRRGIFTVPEGISSKGKCLIRSMLRREPSERMSAREVLEHPWFKASFPVSVSGKAEPKVPDQIVPDWCMEEDEASLFS